MIFHEFDSKWFEVERKMSNFSGKQIHSVDAKGRVIIPVKFREKLGDHFIVAWLGDCLNLYPIDEWERLMEKLDANLPATESGIIEVLSFNSEPVDMDKQGRAILPQDLREKAGIEKDIVSVGSLEKIHVYSKEAWDKKYESVSMEDTVATAAKYGIRL
ncbi:MAG: division/cell wall cluster transcriptional repressor MraZ [Lachnospiraceae bacterium]|nr:division/cell wall cluster transcriptional repressor MraZ [Lachnospiraceae bacterium]